MIVELAWSAGADQVLAEVDPSNVASRKVLLRNGFAERRRGRFVIDKPADDRA